MKHLYELKEMLCDVLEDYSKARLTRENICEIDTIAHATKNICKIIEFCEEHEEGNEEYGYSGRRWTISNKRDPKGRYSSKHGRDGGYSYHSDRELIEELDHLMNEVDDDQTRAAFQKFINKLETM